MAGHSHDDIPHWTWIAPVVATLMLAVVLPGFVTTGVVVQILAAILLAAAVFAAVHHAEVLALKLGEPFGSILLAVAVTVIEVALIVSIMLSSAEGRDAVARDTVFAAVMIVLNGVVGLCLILGAQRHHEQTIQLQGASAALAVLGTLAVLTLVLPNYTVATPGPFYSSFQLVSVGAVSLVLYGVFIFVQTIRHRVYFLDQVEESAADEPVIAKPSNKISVISLALLIVALVAVVLLAKLLSYPLSGAVAAAGLPYAFVGVVIAAVVLLPETVAAVRVALINRLQASMNLALGSAIASIGLTIPTVAVVALITGQPLRLGLDPKSTVLLILTLFISTLTLGTGRTTVLQGAIHLVIFVVFILMSAVP